MLVNLTKGMYADYTCNRFGITYNQMRANPVLANAGWFNLQGQKLGFGDLTMKDLENIANDLDFNELFFVLSEGDSTWNMPSDLNQNEPGINYVMEHAQWVVVALPESSHDIVKIVPASLDFFPTTRGEITFETCSKESFIKEFGFDGEKFNKIKPPVKVDRVFPGAFYGLDTYYLSDGTSWAVGNHSISIEAAKRVARKYIYTLSRTEMVAAAVSEYISNTTWDIVTTLAEVFGERANDAIIKLIGENNTADLCSRIQYNKGNSILAYHDQMIRFTNEYKCLPPGKYAYRIS